MSSAGGIPPPLPREDTTPKLTDTQLIILAATAKRDDASILLLPKKLKCGANAIEAVLPDLIKKKLAAEEPAT